MRLKRNWFKHWLLTSLVWCASACAVAGPPKHIVSLDLCSDWLLAYYSQASQRITLSPLVQRYPLPFAAAQPAMHDGSLEQIMALKPDVVLVGEFNAFMLRKRLEALGVRVVSTPLPQTSHDLEQLSRNVQTMLGLSKASAASSKTVRPEAPVTRHGRLLLLGANGYGVGHNTLEHSLITHAGWENHTTQSGHVKLDMEALVTNPPDAIVASSFRYPAMANTFAQHPVLERAVPAQRWMKTDDWRWQCPGPWMWDLLEQLQP
jgi:iron complex transport system substrate-binding protein